MIVPPQRALDKIAKGNLAPAYLLLGRELYWRDRIWSALKTAMKFDAASSTGIEEMDLRRNPLDEVLSRAQEPNLWIPRQLLLVRNAQLLSTGKSLEGLADYAENPSADAILIFEMTDVDAESDDWREKEKIKARQELWGDLAEVVPLVAPGMAESMELVRREAAQRERKITPQAAENLVAIWDRNLGRIVQEIEKLCLYRAAGEEISADDVQMMAGQSAAGNTLSGLSLADAIGTSNSVKVLESFDQSVPRGAYLPLIIGEITRYLRQLMLLRESKVRDSQEASRLLWSVRLPAPQGSLQGLARQARLVSLVDLSHAMQLAFEADLVLRSSPTDERLIVERLLLNVTDILQPKDQPDSATSVHPHR